MKFKNHLISALVISLSALRVAAADLTTGMVAYWPLDEVQGTKTPDVVRGYDMNLINLTAADLVPGKWGRGF